MMLEIIFLILNNGYERYCSKFLGSAARSVTGFTISSYHWANSDVVRLRSFQGLKELRGSQLGWISGWSRPRLMRSRDQYTHRSLGLSAQSWCARATNRFVYATTAELMKIICLIRPSCRKRRLLCKEKDIPVITILNRCTPAQMPSLFSDDPDGRVWRAIKHSSVCFYLLSRCRHFAQDRPLPVLSGRIANEEDHFLGRSCRQNDAMLRPPKRLRMYCLLSPLWCKRQIRPRTRYSTANGLLKPTRTQRVLLILPAVGTNVAVLCTISLRQVAFRISGVYRQPMAISTTYFITGFRVS